MIGFLILFLHVLISPFRTRARLEAEIVLLRHQLSVLRHRAPLRPRLTVADRLLFVWLYRMFPSVLNAVTNPTGDRNPVASDGVPPVLALEVALWGVGGQKFRWRSAG